LPLPRDFEAFFPVFEAVGIIRQAQLGVASTVGVA
jgi:hypothetical protein